MRSLGSSGVWELFIPDVGAGTLYRYEILGRDGVWRQKSDPMAFRTEKPPANASVVYESSYTWSDAEWLERRAEGQLHVEPMSVYEVHLGSWRRRPVLPPDRRRTGDVRRRHGLHPRGVPAGDGAPVRRFVGLPRARPSSRPTARFGDPDDFRYLVDSLHQAGIGVIADWAPGHFATDEWALVRFDGTPLYEHADPRKGWQPDWGSYVFDFGRREVRNFLLANALYWLEEFHIDGLRVNAVASMLYLDYSRKEGEWTPNEYGGRENLDAVSFLQDVNATCYRNVPGISTIAEESTSWPGVTRPTHLGGLGFGFKWNMGWMNDSLEYVRHEPSPPAVPPPPDDVLAHLRLLRELRAPPVPRRGCARQGLLAGEDAGRPVAAAGQPARLPRVHVGAPGQAAAVHGRGVRPEHEWAESKELDWWLLEFREHQGVQQLVRDLNRIYRAAPELWALDHVPEAFSWIDANDAGNNVFSFVRSGPDGEQCWPASPTSRRLPHEGYRLGLPEAGAGGRRCSTPTARSYFGSGVGNLGEVEAVDQAVARPGRRR